MKEKSVKTIFPLCVFYVDILKSFDVAQTRLHVKVKQTCFIVCTFRLRIAAVIVRKLFDDLRTCDL